MIMFLQVLSNPCTGHRVVLTALLNGYASCTLSTWSSLVRKWGMKAGRRGTLPQDYEPRNWGSRLWSKVRSVPA